METNSKELIIETTQIEKKKFPLYAKISFWMLGLLIFGFIIYIAASFYERTNYCEIQMSITSVSCHKALLEHRGPNEYSPACKGCAVLFKPLILLYPLKSQEVQVELIYTPGFSATFPEYSEEKKGWSVTAYSDATLLDHITGQETYGLFWEGNAGDIQYDLSKGWIIKGSEVREFLYEKLTEIGLNTKEKSDFIMYWYPKLQEYPYVQITFAGNDYTQSAPLVITPKPDSLLRVFMVAKPLSAPMYLEPQKLTKFERKGFSVVEWGGMIVE